MNSGTSAFPALPEISAIIHGSIGGKAMTVPEVSSVAVDSRQCSPGVLFFALPGAISDGARYVYEAVRAGAVAAVVSDARDPSGKDWDVPVIVVPDVLKGLQELAAWYVGACLSGTVRIGVTGSNGKTTTKELIASLLRLKGETFCSYGNYNSETGVPLSVFATPRGVAYAIYEMAMSAPGEMADLAEIVRPQYAVITNIGSAHIGNLGSREAIAAEKKQIASRFTGEQTLLLLEDDPYRSLLSGEINGRVLYFGPRSQNARIIDDGENGVKIVLSNRTIPLSLSGEHNGRNALAALRLAELLEVELDQVEDPFRELSLPSGRAEEIPLPAGGRLIHEGYNANPDSMHAALAMIRSLHKNATVQRDLVLILGEMYELGAWSADGHATVLRAALDLGPRLLCLVGLQFSNALANLERPDYSASTLPRIVTVPEVEQLATILQQQIAGDELVLLKGSRGVALERLIPILTREVAAGV